MAPRAALLALLAFVVVVSGTKAQYAPPSYTPVSSSCSAQFPYCNCTRADPSIYSLDWVSSTPSTDSELTTQCFTVSAPSVDYTASGICSGTQWHLRKMELDVHPSCQITSISFNDEQLAPETRRAYRNVYMTCPGLGEYISGVILFKETLYQQTPEGQPFVKCLEAQGVYAGIKVDEGLQPLDGALPGETWTKGLEGLAASTKEFAAAGAKFAKWRATIKVQPGGPSDAAILRNAEDLASYAVITQASGLVPIVEPEILIDGDHSIDKFREVTERVIAETVTQMWRKGVNLEGSLLKPQMVIPGADCPGGKCDASTVALHTVTALRRVVPAAIPGIMFLSGGQTEEEATINLNTVNTTAASLGRCPWSLSFSFGRALQHSVLKLWSANQADVAGAQAMALALAQVNSQAALGQYQGPHPSTCSAETLRETFRGWRG